MAALGSQAPTPKIRTAAGSAATPSGSIDGRASNTRSIRSSASFADSATDADLLEHVRAWSDEALAYGITSAQAMPWG